MRSGFRSRPTREGAPVSAIRTWVVCLGLFLGTIALFSRSLNFGFINYDDPSYVTDNPHVQGGLSWAGLRWAFAGRTDYWHPLTWLSHMADWELYRDNAHGHHLTSILWHAVNAVLVFLLMRRLTGGFWTSALCAALFAWHPLRVESVVWITERKNVMSGFFFLLTLWAYVAYADRRAAGKPARARYTLALAAFAGGLMCKPVIVALPGVLLLLDFWPLRRLALRAGHAPGGAAMSASGAATTPSHQPLPTLVLEKVPFFILSAIIAAVTVLMQVAVGAFTLNVPLAGRIANAVVSVPRYLGKFIWPFDLTVVYAHPGTWPTVAVIAAGLLVLAITGVAGWLFWSAERRQPWALVGWGWFLVMLLPTLGLVQAGFQAMADRYTYLPVLGLELALLWTFRAALPAQIPGWLKAGAAALLLAACGWRTWDQQATWRDPPTLFTHALAVTRNNYAAHCFLGLTLLDEGRVADAEFHARRAVEINPDFAGGHDVLALVRRQQGHTDEAMAGFRQTLKLMPRYAAAHCDLGFLLLRQNQPAEAATHFQAALQIDPDLVAAHVGMARVETIRRNAPAAVSDYEQALNLSPGDWQLHNNLAVLLASLERFTEARRHFEAALRIAPQIAQTHFNFARMLRDTGHFAEAVEQSRQAVALQPDDPAMQVELARSLERLGRTDEAYGTFERAAKLRPGDVEAWCGMGDVLLQRHRPEEARRCFAAALRNQPESSPAYLGLAFVADQLGQADDVLANLQQALRYSPEDAAVLRMLGDTLARQGRIAEAAANYERALQVHPGDAATEARLGYALFLLRRPAEAVRHWEEALRLDPKIPGLRERIEQAQRELMVNGDSHTEN